MKKNKLSLENFKVQSFVTSLNSSLEQTAKGGHCPDTQEQCSQGPQICEYDTSPGVCHNSGVVGPGPNTDPVCFETFAGDCDTYNYCC